MPTFKRYWPHLVLFLIGLSTGYVLFGLSTVKKHVDAEATLARAGGPANDHYDDGAAVLALALKKASEGSDPGADRSVQGYLASYYAKRMKLSEADRKALGVDSVLEMIDKLREKNSALDAVVREKVGK